MKKALWKDQIIAQSDKTIVVEGNHYFPAESLTKEFFSSSSTHTTCGWKGIASYYNIVVDGQTNPDAAWFYPSPKEAANNIANYVAFWKGVTVS